MRKYKLSEVAKIEISGVDKKTIDGEIPVKLCNFVDVYRNWAITSRMIDRFMDATAKPNEIARFTIKRGQVAIIARLDLILVSLHILPTILMA